MCLIVDKKKDSRSSSSSSPHLPTPLLFFLEYKRQPDRAHAAQGDGQPLRGAGHRRVVHGGGGPHARRALPHTARRAGGERAVHDAPRDGVGRGAGGGRLQNRVPKIAARVDLGAWPRNRCERGLHRSPHVSRVSKRLQNRAPKIAAHANPGAVRACVDVGAHGREPEAHRRVAADLHRQVCGELLREALLPCLEVVDLVGRLRRRVPVRPGRPHVQQHRRHRRRSSAFGAAPGARSAGHPAGRRAPCQKKAWKCARQRMVASTCCVLRCACCVQPSACEMSRRMQPKRESIACDANTSRCTEYGRATEQPEVAAKMAGHAEERNSASTRHDLMSRASLNGWARAFFTAYGMSRSTTRL